MKQKWSSLAFLCIYFSYYRNSQNDLASVPKCFCANCWNTMSHVPVKIYQTKSCSSMSGSLSWGLNYFQAKYEDQVSQLEEALKKQHREIEKREEDLFALREKLHNHEEQLTELRSLKTQLADMEVTLVEKNHIISSLEDRLHAIHPDSDPDVSALQRKISVSIRFRSHVFRQWLDAWPEWCHQAIARANVVKLSINRCDKYRIFLT